MSKVSELSNSNLFFQNKMSQHQVYSRTSKDSSGNLKKTFANIPDQHKSVEFIYFDPDSHRGSACCNNLFGNCNIDYNRTVCTNCEMHKCECSTNKNKTLYSCRPTECRRLSNCSPCQYQTIGLGSTCQCHHCGGKPSKSERVQLSECACSSDCSRRSHINFSVGSGTVKKGVLTEPNRKVLVVEGEDFIVLDETSGDIEIDESTPKPKKKLKSTYSSVSKLKGFSKVDGSDGNDCTVISDSMCRYVSGLVHTDIQCCGGLTVARATRKIKSGVLKVKEYGYIILHIGTNDIYDLSEEEFEVQYRKLVELIKELNPDCKLCFSAIIPRPIDKVTKLLNDKRLRINFGLKLLSEKNKDYYFFQTDKRFTDKKYGVPIESLFRMHKGDRVHLNWQGSRILSEYLHGSLGRIRPRI